MDRLEIWYRSYAFLQVLPPFNSVVICMFDELERDQLALGVLRIGWIFTFVSSNKGLGRVLKYLNFRNVFSINGPKP